MYHYGESIGIGGVIKTTPAANKTLQGKTHQSCDMVINVFPDIWFCIRLRKHVGGPCPNSHVKSVCNFIM